jgi:hypothetical protein
MAEAAFAHGVQRGLHLVGEQHHRLEAEQARRALDGVGSTEGAVDGLVVLGVDLHGQQGFFKLAQQVVGLVEKAGAGGGEDVVVGLHGVSPQAAAAASSQSHSP